MTHAFICDAIRTPFGRYGGALSSVRTDDLGAIPIRALMARNPGVDWAARAIKAGEAQLMIAGGVESMSRAPFVMPKAESAFSRANAVYDTTIGWRFVNKLMKAQYGVDSMPETAENVARDFGIEREAQDRMALASQLKAVAAQQAGHLAREITPVTIPQKKGEAIVVAQDEHP
ncbi:MAG: beta-ketoadipyl CoA thiolase, partial [Burkholderiales bacterium PBB5]